MDDVLDNAGKRRYVIARKPVPHYYLLLLFLLLLLLLLPLLQERNMRERGKKIYVNFMKYVVCVIILKNMTDYTEVHNDWKK